LIRDVLIARKAEKDIKHLTNEYKERIKNALRLLSAEPFKGEALLGEFKGLRRYRIGDFRIIYGIDLQKQYLIVIRVRHRKEVYR